MIEDGLVCGGGAGKSPRLQTTKSSCCCSARATRRFLRRFVTAAAASRFEDTLIAGQNVLSRLNRGENRENYHGFLGKHGIVPAATAEIMAEKRFTAP
jgi:hypothetical protein